MPTYLVRVWVPDRPGALGAVASRIGAVRGDLVGIDILERGGGRAIDELVVELPDEALVPLLLTEMAQVDGVDVEDIRAVSAAVTDPRLDALETAALLCGQLSVPELLETTTAHACRDFGGDWGVVLDPGPASAIASVGTPPDTAWLHAFVAGSRLSLAPGGSGPDDVAWAELPGADLVLLLGRRGRPFRSRERRQLSALAMIVDRRWQELVTRSARMLHPSQP